MYGAFATHTEVRVRLVVVLGDMVIFHIVISPACEIADTRYYRAWLGGGKRETLCTCHRLFHNYLVISNRAWEREREPGFPMRRRSLKARVYFTFCVPVSRTAASAQHSKYTQPLKSADRWAQHMRRTTNLTCAVSKHCLHSDATVREPSWWRKLRNKDGVRTA